MSFILDSFLDDIISDVAEKYPDKPALIYGDASLTYREFIKRVEALTTALLLQGVVPGDFVATLLHPGLDITPALLAIHRVGAIYTPLDPDHPPDQLQTRLQDVDAKLILVDSQSWEKASALNTPGLEVTSLLHQGFVNRTAIAMPERSLENPACIFFTSGTTGKPKGVVGSFRAMRDSILEPTVDLGFEPQDRINSMARYAWSISMLELLSPLVVGGTSVILDRSISLNFDELKNKLMDCTAFHAPPALLKSFSLYLLNNPDDIDAVSHIRFVWYGGDKLSIDSIRCVQAAFPNAVVCTAYGATEIFGLSHCYFYSRDPAPERVLVGKPVGKMKQIIMADGVDISGETSVRGEILLGGDRVALEYWGQPDLTESCFQVIEGKRFYATGDYGRLDDAGNLEFVEREDAQIKVRGIRIELGEVEFLITNSPRVSEAVVLANQIDEETKELCAFVIFNEANRGKCSELRQELKAELPEYLVPARLVEVDKFPMTENFKVDRKALLRRIHLHSDSTSSAPGLTEPLALSIAEIWKKAAGINPQNLSDNFFELGGNSLTAAVVAASLGRHFGMNIPVADIYRAPSLAAQLEKIRLGNTSAAKSETAFPGKVYAAEGQKGLVFRELFEKRDSSITCTRYIGCSDSFNESLVRQSLIALIERFPTLKTNLKYDTGEILLIEQEDVAPEAISITRATGFWSLASVPETGARPLIKHQHNFNIRKDILIAATINEIKDGGEVLQLTAHHVAADDNSMGRIGRDFVEIYESLRTESLPRLEQVESSYRSFALSQSLDFSNGVFQQSATIVAEHLLSHYDHYGNQPLVCFETNRGRSIRATNYEMPRDIVEGGFVDYVAALSWAFFQVFGRNEFVFCAHVALERDSDAEPKVGMFVNLVPIFIQIGSEDSPEAHIGHVKGSFEEAMTRSNVPYEFILTRNEKLRRLRGFPFDAFVNELDFIETYPYGYQHIVVSRTLSTDSREISMSVMYLENQKVLKFEYPEFPSHEDVISQISSEVVNFLNQQSPDYSEAQIQRLSTSSTSKAEADQ